MKKLLALLLLSPLVYSQSAIDILGISDNEKAEITVERKKAFLYSALKVQVKANNALVAKVLVPAVSTEYADATFGI